jgi:hypothetical protein
MEGTEDPALDTILSTIKPVKQENIMQKLQQKMNRKTERQEKADRLSKVLTEVNRENELEQRQAASKLQDAVRRKLPLDTSTQQLINETLRTRKQFKQDSAITIQNAIRSKQARTEFKQNKELKSISDSVVNDIQNQIRKQQDPFINAGTKIQSAIRGQKGRKETAIKLETKIKHDKINEIGDKYIRQKAASTIQRKVRRKKNPVIISTEPLRPSTKPMIDIISDRVSKNVVKNSLDKIIKKQQTASAATLQNAMRRKTDMMRKNN